MSGLLRPSAQAPALRPVQAPFTMGDFLGGGWDKGSGAASAPPAGPPKQAQAPLPSFYAAGDAYGDLLGPLLAGMGDVAAEAKAVGEQGWKEWPEQHYSDGGAQDWKVFPFCHTFPANDCSRTTFIPSCCAQCPTTTRLLKSLGPYLRTALFSRLGPNARISSHRGWADLANHVLR
jgi:hypothetical protein